MTDSREESTDDLIKIIRKEFQKKSISITCSRDGLGNYRATAKKCIASYASTLTKKSAFIGCAREAYKRLTKKQKENMREIDFLLFLLEKTTR
jgi:hypothetical protein